MLQDPNALHLVKAFPPGNPAIKLNDLVPVLWLSLRCEEGGKTVKPSQWNRERDEDSGLPPDLMPVPDFMSSASILKGDLRFSLYPK
jgi:hypothetical protein